MKKSIIILFNLFISCNIFSQNTSQTNIILMIGDGMGLTHISAGMYSLNNNTALESFPFVGLVKTHSHNALVTDSAASGTAFACGEKTLNGTIGINPQNKKIKSILKHSKEKGYKTGIIATSTIVHATPASFYANVLSRNQYEDIALQLSQSDVDFFIGGGRDYFTRRKDKRNLIEEMSSHEFVYSLKKFTESKSNKIGFLTSLGDPVPINQGRKPKLSNAVEEVLSKLSSNQEPFFLVVEGSQIDWGGHKNDINYVISEFKDFDEAIKSAINFSSKNKNTLVIVTSDHETGGLAITGGKIKRFQIKTKFNTIGHSATMVPIFSYGPNSELFSGVYDNTEIFDKMLSTINN